MSSIPHNPIPQTGLLDIAPWLSKLPLSVILHILAHIWGAQKNNEFTFSGFPWSTSGVLQKTHVQKIHFHMLSTLKNMDYIFVHTQLSL